MVEWKEPIPHPIPDEILWQCTVAPPDGRSVDFVAVSGEEPRIRQQIEAGALERITTLSEKGQDPMIVVRRVAVVAGATIAIGGVGYELYTRRGLIGVRLGLIAKGLAEIATNTYKYLTRKDSELERRTRYLTWKRDQLLREWKAKSRYLPDK